MAEFAAGMMAGGDDLVKVPPFIGDNTRGMPSIGDPRPIIGFPPDTPFIPTLAISATIPAFNTPNIISKTNINYCLRYKKKPHFPETNFLLTTLRVQFSIFSLRHLQT